MRLAPSPPNVLLRTDPERGRIVVLSFPYDPNLVEVVRAIPHRRFDWDAREWWAPVEDWVAHHVADVLRRFPELTPSEEAAAWLEEIQRRWLGRVATTRYDGRGWFVLETAAGEVPAELLPGSVELPAEPRVGGDGAAGPRRPLLLVPLTEANAHVLRAQDSARLDPAAERCIAALELGDQPPPARLVATHGVDGARLRLEVLWDPDTGAAFGELPGAEGERSSRSTRSSRCTGSRWRRWRRRCWMPCARRRRRRRRRSAPRARRRASRSPRWPRSSAARSSRSSGPACATR
jgi:hypothetical protein